MSDLFFSCSLGNPTLSNRLVTAPMTRNRASDLGAPGELMATYCGQRAGAGLRISESVPVSQQAVAYP